MIILTEPLFGSHQSLVGLPEKRVKKSLQVISDDNPASEVVLILVQF